MLDTVRELVPSLVRVMPEELAAIDGGLLAVIAPDHLLPEVRAGLSPEYGDRVGSGAGGPGQDIVVIGPRESKGLEFDGVVILEPQEMLDSATARVGDLYVAMTRPTQRLRVISTGRIPAGIAG